MKKRKVILVVLGLILLLTVGCAAGPNSLAETENEEGETAGFLLGLWHGIIAPVTLIISIFSDKISMYEVHNSGLWYNVGFLFGAAVTLGGGSKSTCRRRDTD